MTLRAAVLLSSLTTIITYTATGEIPAQAGPDSGSVTGLCRLLVTSGSDTTCVVVDSIIAGQTPLLLDSLSPGLHTLRVFRQEDAGWPGGAAADTIVLTGGESREVDLPLPRAWWIRTRPFGAQVYAGDSLLGTTPFLVMPDLPSNRLPIILRKQGFDSVLIAPRGGTAGSMVFNLKPVWGSDWSGDSLFAVAGAGNSKMTRAYVTGALTILAGTAAAYFKIRADDRYQSYVQTGNPSFLSETHRFDTAAGVFLGLTQVGIAVFMYLLFSD